jgi:hypothetical protein
MISVSRTLEFSLNFRHVDSKQADRRYDHPCFLASRMLVNAGFPWFNAPFQNKDNLVLGSICLLWFMITGTPFIYLWHLATRSQKMVPFNQLLL